MRKGFLGAIATGLMLFSLGAQALPQAYDISWDGRRGYSLTGMFSYEGGSSGLITQDDLTGFMIEGFHRGNSIGVFQGRPELFFFDAGQTYIPSLLQAWNIDGQGINFGCILTLCGMGKDGELIKKSKTLFTHIDVSPKVIEGNGGGQTLSAPTGILALFAGLVALAFRRRASS